MTAWFHFETFRQLFVNKTNLAIVVGAAAVDESRAHFDIRGQWSLDVLIYTQARLD
jgi:hypothetical protein